MLLLLVSCRQPDKEIAWLMEQAETVLEQNPDSALRCLYAVQDPEGPSEMQRMNYYLLLVQAKDKAGKDISEDTVICEVKDYFLQKKDFEKATLAAFYEGHVFATGKDNQRALQAFLEAENIAEHITDTKRKGLIQYNIGWLYYAAGTNYEEAIARLKKATGYFQVENYYKYAIASFNLLGTCFLIQERADSALFYQQQGLDMAIAHADTATWTTALQNISVTYRKMGDKQRAKASALMATDLNKAKGEAISALLNLSYIYYDYVQYDSAAFYVDKILQMPEEEQTPHTLSSVYTLLTKIKKACNDYKKALEYQEKYIELIYKIFKKQEEQSIAGIQEKYNMEIVKNENQKLVIQRLWYFVIASLVFLLSIGVIFFLYHRYNKQKNHLLKVNKERDKLYAQRLDVIKQTNLFEKRLKKTEKEQYVGLLPKIKQIIYDSPEGLTWETLYNVINEQYSGNLDRLKKEYGQLTNSEFKICCLVYAGFSNEEIATSLQFMLNTVKTRRVSIGRKLGMPKKGNLQKFLVEKLG